MKENGSDSAENTVLSHVNMWLAIWQLPVQVARLLRTFPQFFMAGGFIRAVVGGEKVKDIDIFTTDASVVETAVQWLIQQYPRDVAVKELRTLNTLTVRVEGQPDIQFIDSAAYPSPRECVDKFDFTVCQAAMWFDPVRQTWHSYCSPSFVQDVKVKRLVYTAPKREEAPGGSLWRAVKYVAKGYSITQDEFAKLVVRLNTSLVSLRLIKDDDDDDDDDDADELQCVCNPKAIRGALSYSGYCGR